LVASSEESDEFDDDDNPKCFYCNGRYLDVPGEKWIVCTGKCKRWCHDACASVDYKMFVCEFCE